MRTEEDRFLYIPVGMGLGISWLAATAYGAGTRCPKCRKWFAGRVQSRLPADGVEPAQRPENGRQKPMFDVTYACKFCNGFWIEREN